MTRILILLLILSTPSYADGTNGGTIQGSVSITIDNSVTCDLYGCVTNDNEVIEPIEISNANGVVYAY